MVEHRMAARRSGGEDSVLGDSSQNRQEGHIKKTLRRSKGHELVSEHGQDCWSGVAEVAIRWPADQQNSGAATEQRMSGRLLFGGNVMNPESLKNIQVEMLSEIRWAQERD